MRDCRGLWRRFSILLLFGPLFGPFAWSAPSRAEPPLWEALRAGVAVALIRHAEAPGTGDPAGFKLDDCATQRNLSDAGRRQARRIGAALRENGIAGARVLSSRWCRCLETARLLELGPVEPFPPLDSFFSHPERGPAQTAALRESLRGPGNSLPRVLVTHQVNITAMTGVVPRSGEMIVVRPLANGEIQLMGRLEPGRERSERASE